MIALNHEGRYNGIIKKAKENYYHDFRSYLTAPKLALLQDLEEFPELEPLKKRVIEGEFDESF